MTPARSVWVRGSAMLLSLLVAAAAEATHPDFTGYWQATRASAALQPEHGPVPMLDGAAAAWRQHVAAAKAGDTSWDSANQCIPPGTPRTMAEPYPLEIVQEPTKVSMLFQMERLYRTIPTDGWSNASEDPTFMGISMGHWDGDTFVVETKNFKPDTFINDSGVPHSDQLQLTERWTLISAQTLTDRIEITDPQTFSKPWTTVLVLKRLHGVQFAEDVCVDRVRAANRNKKK